jgi:hypothetical protein
MADRLGDLAAPESDLVGLQLDEENLPRRIRVAPAGSPGTDDA